MNAPFGRGVGMVEEIEDRNGNRGEEQKPEVNSGAFNPLAPNDSGLPMMDGIDTEEWLKVEYVENKLRYCDVT